MNIEHTASTLEQLTGELQNFQNIAKEILSNIQALNLDSVYMVQEQNLFKVQMGNYGERREAEIMLDRLRYAGIENAWIVNATIHVPKPP